MKTAITLVVSLLCVNFIFSQTNQWTWVIGPNVINDKGLYLSHGVDGGYPKARLGATYWTDTAGNFWLFGGQAYNPIISGIAYLNDLWKFNPQTRQWTWVSGDSTLNQPGRYGQRGIPSPLNNPGARNQRHSWIDKQGNLWLYGGSGYSASAYGRLGDLWKFNIQTNEWTWVMGDSSVNAIRVYGNLGVPSTLNTPGSRTLSASWTDTAGNFWLYGGMVPIPPFNPLSMYIMGDLWKYNPSSNQWTWVNGDSAFNRSRNYGIRGMASASNKPGARYLHTTFSDTANNLWFFGGYWPQQGSIAGASLNDLWKYNIASNQWTWVRGDSVGGTANNGVYGTQGVASPASSPGHMSETIITSNSHQSWWLFSGQGFAETGATGWLNDLWNYNPVTNEWAWMKGSKAISTLGIYGTPGNPAPANTPGGRTAAAGWEDRDGNLWIFGGNGYATTSTYGNMNDMWKYTPGVVMPVHLLSFTAKQWTVKSGQPAFNSNQPAIKLNWTSENEQNFDHYDIERSSDGRTFIQVKRQMANGKNGKNDYEYVDDLSRFTSYSSPFYYRLKLLDKDGSFSYSKTERVSFNTYHSQLILYPNPATTQVRLQLDKPLTGKTSIEVTDESGKRLMSKLIEGSQVTILFTSKLAAGQYVVKVRNGEEEYVQKMIIKK